MSRQVESSRQVEQPGGGRLHARDRLGAFLASDAHAEAPVAAPWARAIINDPSPKLALFSADRVGTTTLLGWELAAIGLDRHPTIKATEDRKIVLIRLPADGGWACDISVAVHKFLPEGALDPRCKYWKDRGYRVGNVPMVLFKGGVAATPSSRLAGVSGFLAVFANTLAHGHREDATFERIYACPGGFGDQAIAQVVEKVCGDPDLFEEPRAALEPVTHPTGWRHYRVGLSTRNVPYRTPESLALQASQHHGPTHRRRVGGWLRAGAHV